MAVCDFVVKFNPETDNMEVLTERILYSLIIRRLKNHKPVVMFVGGDSGEGKSFSAIRLQELLLKIQGLDPSEFFDDINVFTPLQYPQKIDKLLNDKALKKVNIICVHEGREVVKAKNWQSFLTQSIADVNAMSRSLKRLCIMIISQFIRDITNDIRYTLNFYCIVRRPRGAKARLYINLLWKDDRDLMKPQLKRRKIAGYLKYPDGKFRRFVPQYLIMSKPSPEIVKKFLELDKAAKADIIRNKLNKLVKDMESELGVESPKIDSMVEYYTKDQDRIAAIGKRSKKGFKLSKIFSEMHDLTKEEKKQFQEKLVIKLKKIGMIEK